MTVPRQTITPQKIADHVKRLGDLHPPIPLESVDRTIRRPDPVAQRFGHVIDYLARVELEVDQSRLLWAHKKGMEVPPYILNALKEAVELHRAPALSGTAS